MTRQLDVGATATQIREGLEYEGEVSVNGREIRYRMNLPCHLMTYVNEKTINRLPIETFVEDKPVELFGDNYEFVSFIAANAALQVLGDPELRRKQNRRNLERNCHYQDCLELSYRLNESIIPKWFLTD